METESSLILDENNRIAYKGEVNFEPSSYFLNVDDESLEDLRKDCKSVFNNRSSKKNSSYSSGQTYFVSADAKPRCALEALALSIFETHTKKAIFESGKSGVEWWTLSIDCEDDIGLHFDRDYGIEEEYGMHIYPHIATVTYLSEYGAPTLVFNHIGSEDNESGCEGSVSELVVSKPFPRKHFSFDGRLLHGAPSTLFQSIKVDQVRQTFLANIWLNHTPIESERLNQKVAKSLKLSLDIAFTLELTSKNIPEFPVIGAKEDQLQFLHAGMKFEVNIPLPDDDEIIARLVETNTLNLTYESNKITIVEAKRKRKSKSSDGKPSKKR